MTSSTISSAREEVTPHYGAAAAAPIDASLQFAQVGVVEGLQRAVAAQGDTLMTPIQAEAIQNLLAGRDVMVAARVRWASP